MEVKINNFRKIDSFTTIFERGLILFKGQSGIGKTTILEAIKWCLYGHLRQVYPIGGKKETYVMITIDNLMIKRSKPPEILELKKDDLELKNDEAQEYIHQIFGSREIWENSSYISQDERISLLTGSNQNKLDLIREIVFQDKDNINGNELKDIFQNKLNEREKESLVLEKMINLLREKIKNFEEEKKDILKDLDPCFYSSKLYKSKDLLSEKKKELEEKIRKNNENIIRKENRQRYEEMLKINQENLKDYPENLSWELFSDWKKYLSNEETIKDLENTYNNNYDIENDNIDEIREKLYIIKKNKQIEKNIDINNLETEKIKLQKKLEKINIYNKFGDLIEERDKITNYYEKMKNPELVNTIVKNWHYFLDKLKEEKVDYSSEKYFQLKNKLNQLQGDFLKCPKCEKELILHQNKLKINELNFEKKELKKLVSILENTKTYYDNISNAEEKIKQYQKLNIPDNIEKPEDLDVKTLEKKLKLIDDYIPVDMDIDEINIRILNINLKEEILKLKKKRNKLYNDMFENYDINKINIQDYISMVNNIKEAKKFLNECENELETEDQEKLSNLNNRLDEKLEIIREQENKHEIYKILQKYKKDIKEEEEKLKLTIREIEKCREILKIINTSENESFETFINFFNSIINDILSMLFENIQFELKAFKEKNKSIKAQIDYDIILNGQKYDNWHVLSGGEKDRLSIAITLALNYFRKCPFLFLDECMSSLDSDNRTKCLSAIKHFAKDKIVLNICHETIEGYYDKIMEF
jgi:DNA repair exonuclease SbcCD ATPase subunit